MKMTQGNIKFLVSVIVLFVGISLGYIGMFQPPIGEIHPSVLTYVGEILTFVGSVWGIGQYASIQLAKFQNSQDRSQDR